MVKPEPVCGISVVKREIAVVFTTAISILVDPIGIEPTTLRMRTVRSPRLSYGPKSTVPKAEQKKQYEIIRCGRKPNPLRSQLSYRPIFSYLI